MGPKCNHKHPSKGGGKGDLTVKQEESNNGREGLEECEKGATVQGMLVASGSWRKGFFPGAARANEILLIP